MEIIETYFDNGKFVDRDKIEPKHFKKWGEFLIGIIMKAAH